MKRTAMMLTLLLTIVSATHSQTNSNNDTCCIKKSLARKAIQANRDNKTMLGEITDLKKKIDTLESIREDQTHIIKEASQAIELNIQLREIANRQAYTYKEEAKLNDKKARKFKRQRNGVAVGSILAVICAIIFI